MDLVKLIFVLVYCTLYSGAKFTSSHFRYLLGLIVNTSLKQFYKFWGFESRLTEGGTANLSTMTITSITSPDSQTVVSVTSRSHYAPSVSLHSHFDIRALSDLATSIDGASKASLKVSDLKFHLKKLISEKLILVNSVQKNKPNILNKFIQHY